MAFVLLGAQGAFVPGSRDNLVANQALAGFALQDATAQAAILQGSGMAFGYDARAQATTTAADTSSVVLDLSARGVTFPAGFIRLIQTDAFVRTVASTTESAFSRTFDIIIGGTNPTRVTPAAGTPRIQVLTATTTVVTAGAFINTTPTPDTVEIQITGGAYSITWDVRVYCSPLIALA